MQVVVGVPNKKGRVAKVQAAWPSIRQGFYCRTPIQKPFLRRFKKPAVKIGVVDGQGNLILVFNSLPRAEIYADMVRSFHGDCRVNYVIDDGNAIHFQEV